MKTFKDNAARNWTITINVAAVKRVRDLLKVNLMEAVEGNLIERLSVDPVLLCDIIYALCKPEADSINVTDEEFGAAMGGDSLDLATTALLEELVDFFPPAKRRVLSKALAKFKILQTKAVEFAEAKVESMDVEKAIQEALDDTFGSVTN